MVINHKAWQPNTGTTYVQVSRRIDSIEKNCYEINQLVCFNSAVPNFKLKINNKIEFKARGNGLLEARGNGSMMFTLHLINFCEIGRAHV